MRVGVRVRVRVMVMVRFMPPMARVIVWVWL